MPLKRKAQEHDELPLQIVQGHSTQDDCFLVIFARLPTAVVLSQLSLVCKRWHHLAQISVQQLEIFRASEHFFQTIHLLPHLTDLSIKSVSNPLVLVPIAHQLKRIRIHQYSEEFVPLLDALPLSLESLSLTAIFEGFDAPPVWRTIERCAPNLVELALKLVLVHSDVPFSDPHTMIECPRLQRLELGCPLRLRCPELVALKLCSYPDTFEDDFVLFYVQNSPKLRTYVGNQLVESIPSTVSHLVTEEAVSTEFLESRPSLAAVSLTTLVVHEKLPVDVLPPGPLRKLHNVGDAWTRHSQILDTVEDYHLEFDVERDPLFPLPKPDVLKKLSVALVQDGYEFELADIVNWNQLAAHLSPFSNLHSLKVLFKKGVRAYGTRSPGKLEFFISLLENLPLLTHLTTCFFPPYTEKLTETGQLFANLTRLKVFCCVRPTLEDVIGMLRLCPNLTSFVVESHDWEDCDDDFFLFGFKTLMFLADQPDVVPKLMQLRLPLIGRELITHRQADSIHVKLLAVRPQLTDYEIRSEGYNRLVSDLQLRRRKGFETSSLLASKLAQELLQEYNLLELDGGSDDEEYDSDDYDDYDEDEDEDEEE